MTKQEYARIYDCITRIPVASIPNIRVELCEKSARLFQSLHDSPTDSKTFTIKQRSHSEVKRIADEYRQLLDNYVATLTSKRTRENMQELKTYRNIQYIWRLCDILYFEEHKSDKCSSRIVQWWHAIDRSAYKFDIQGILYCRNPLQHAEFWPLVYKLILRGELDTLSRFLNKLDDTHASKDPDLQQLEWLKTALKQIPRIPTNDDNEMELEKYAQHVLESHKETDRLSCQLKGEEPSTAASGMTQRILLALSILQGDQDAINQCAENSTEAIIAMLIYNQPRATTQDMHEFGSMIRTSSSATTTQSAGGSLPPDLPVIYAHMLSGNICAALELLPSIDIWLIAHLMDLLCMGPFSELIDMPIYVDDPGQDQSYNVECRTLFILLYVRCLSENPSLWKYGLSYLSTCGVLGQQSVAEYISRARKEDTKTLQELLAYCMKNDLNQEKLSVCKIILSQSMDEKNYSTALYYGCLVSDWSTVDEICERIMWDYARTGRLQDHRHLSERHDPDRIGPRTLFLLRYSEMHKAIEEKDYQEVAQILFGLLMSEETPFVFLPLVFIQCLTMLQEQRMWYSADQVRSLQQVLDEMREQENPRGFELLSLYTEYAHGTCVVGNVQVLKETFFALISRCLERYYLRINANT